LKILEKINTFRRNLWGKDFGNKRYLSAKLFKSLFSKSVMLFAKLKRDMENQLIGIADKLM